jgi:inner membrane protein
MDNVTHALAGLALAEAAVQLRRARTGDAPSARFRTVAWLAGAAAANLPDADLLYTAAAGDKIAYLLHHRGHTHTVVGGAVGAALAWVAALAAWRWRARRDAGGPDAGGPGAGDRRWLLALIVAAVASHLGLDWTNNYGVHPFWPADDAWRYGDTTYIVEPWLWVAAVPPLLFAARRRAARVGLALVLAAGLLLAWTIALVPWGAALALTAGAAAALGAARRLAPAARPAVALGAWVAVELAFAAGTGAARRGVAAAARATDPAARLADVVVTPAPANPLCASALVVEAAGPARATYRVTTAWAAAAPALLSADGCRRAGGGGGDTRGVPMTRSPRAASAAVRWDHTWSAPLAELAALGRDNCQIAALLRFARVPFWVAVDASTLHAGDLRYARGPDLGFADLVVPRHPTACPTAVPSWRPPRGDLLGR